MSTFSIEEINRYSRQLMLEEVGAEGQIKIKQARVLVVGAGGLGCPVLQYLNAAGIGTIGIVDFDSIEIHNLHRQILYTTDDIGKPKAPTAAGKLKLFNPHVHCIVFEELIQESNSRDIISQFDIVVDGSDNFLTRYLVNDSCVALGKPLVYGSILNFEGQLAVFNYQGSKNLRDLYPEPPNPEDVPSCSENGVLGSIPGIIGTMMCHFVFKIILQRHLQINKIFILNLDEFSLRELTF